MNEGRAVRIPLAVAGCVFLWLTAVALLIWESLAGDVPAVGGWGLLVSAAAVPATVLVALRHTRRQFADAIETRVRKAFQEEQIASLDVARRG